MVQGVSYTFWYYPCIRRNQFWRIFLSFKGVTYTRVYTVHKVETKSHPSPLCPLCNTDIYNTHHLFNYTHLCTTLSTLDLWTDPAGVTAQLATSGNIRLLLLFLVTSSWQLGHRRSDRHIQKMSFRSGCYLF